MAGVYSVTQVNSYIKNMFVQDFLLRRISVKGEVSNCKYHSSGHIYFTLKDSGGTLSAVMFAGQRKGLGFRLAEGQQVVVKGTVDVYERDGRYQLYASEIELAGRGDLYVRFEKLLRELEEMGMFAAQYKRPIPRYAMSVGIVTAPTGAAIRDIINISRRRNPYVQLILYPALVQGQGARESIVNGIRTLDAMGLDVLIVGRGGGSIEDLWAFNEEEVARAIFACETPVISAVGHETDVTVADYVADLRAPTPSAAAELAVFDYARFAADLEARKRKLSREMGFFLDQVKGRLRQDGLKGKKAAAGGPGGTAGTDHGRPHRGEPVTAPDPERTSLPRHGPEDGRRQKKTGRGQRQALGAFSFEKAEPGLWIYRGSGGKTAGLCKAGAAGERDHRTGGRRNAFGPGNGKE